ncbi:glutamine ABC transporter permease [Dictyobacter vulcani]|uniref:Glutamine ABC transporter permease n=1 Tax=Dictyobacter vulcani TaxID=2607529 RepID=A0A5J4KGZ7_9CHLR|nr:amino acid ABC transporter permease [Dictyobacter vulcani]GER88734.1 glutamine ABC transporter permease [Dictyobacter vulcani]
MDVIWPVLPDFLVGARNTIFYCLAAFPLALILGLLLALMDDSRFIWLRNPARIFIEVVRGTPIVAQIFIVYYGLGALLASLHPSWALWINNWTAGIGTLALNYAAYEAEIYRAGFQSVEKGQEEAALSLGLTPSQNFFRIQLPQAIPLMIPPFVNDFIYLLKDSAVISVIAGTELTSVLNFFVRKNASNPMPFFLLAIVLYLLMSLPVSYVAKRLERRLRAAL